MTLTQHRLKELLHYNPDTGVMTWKVHQGCMMTGQEAGAIVKLKHSHYIHIQIDRKLIYLHRLAFLYMTGAMPRNDMDHKDGDGLNNKWVNLRPCTRAENCQNHALRSDSRSGFVGVGWHKSAGKWRARIKLNGREIFLGCFDDPEQASLAYLAAKTNIHSFNPVPRAMA